MNDRIETLISGLIAILIIGLVFMASIGIDLVMHAFFGEARNLVHIGLRAAVMTFICMFGFAIFAVKNLRLRLNRRSYRKKKTTSNDSIPS